MKLSFNNNVVGLSAETEEEREICALLSVADGHVFQLHCTSERGFSLTELGPQADACREPLNITRTVAPPFQAISNLAHTRFELDGETYASVEGFWQGLKFEEPVERRKVAKLWGPEAKARGDGAGQPATFEFGGVVVAAGSPEHWGLMRRAYEAKFTQNTEAAAALKATGQRWLTHKTRRDSRTIPGAIMAQIWMDVRAGLQK